MVVTIVVAAICFTLQSEEVSTFSLKRDPLIFDGKEINVPASTVALDEFFTIPPINSLFVINSTFSFFFLIDNSGSMKNAINEGSVAADRYGKRFAFYRELLDTIYRLTPRSEVGLAIFGTYLWFDTTDNKYFDRLPTPNDTGAYLQLLVLDSLYKPLGKTGYTIIRELLETDTMMLQQQQFVDLRYKSTNSLYSKDSTDIDIGLEAVKHAFRLSKLPKERHILLFATDGEDNYPPSKYFMLTDCKNIPRTFTLCYSTTDSVSPSLEKMNSSIQSNGYSNSNITSTIYPVQRGTDLAFESIIQRLYPPLPKTIRLVPFNCVINGTKPASPWNDTGFFYNAPFPLCKDKTAFTASITYTLLSTIDKMNPTTIQLEFSAVKNPSLPPADSIVLRRWDRSLACLVNGNSVDEIKNSTPMIELRFTEKKIERLYGYTEVTLELTTGRSASDDHEVFMLQKVDDGFSVQIPLRVEAAIQGDGVLQPKPRDTVVVTFRNSRLPLDTLVKFLPFDPGISIEQPKLVSHVNRGSYTITVYALNGRKTFQRTSQEQLSLAVEAFNHNDLQYWMRHAAMGVYLVKFSYKEPANGSVVWERTRAMIR